MEMRRNLAAQVKEGMEEDIRVEDSDNGPPIRTKLPSERVRSWKKHVLLSMAVVALVALILSKVQFSGSSSISGRSLSAVSEHRDETASKSTRILYIITTLAEYNSGTRNTVRGSDRYATQ